MININLTKRIFKEKKHEQFYLIKGKFLLKLVLGSYLAVLFYFAMFASQGWCQKAGTVILCGVQSWNITLKHNN